MNTLIELSIIIISYKRDEELRRSIESCLLHRTIPCEIIVVDNANSSATQRITNSFSIYRDVVIKYIASEKNLGVAGGRNLGYSLSTGNFCYFIDDDAEVIGDDKVIDRLVEYAKENVEVGAIGTYCNDSNRGVLVGLTAKNDDQKNPEILSFVGCSHLIVKDRYPVKELYPERLMYGAEERYAALMVYTSGRVCKQYNDMIINHYPSPNGRDKLINNELSSYVNEELIKSFFIPLIFVPVVKCFAFTRYIKHGIRWKVSLKTLFQTILILKRERSFNSENTSKLTIKQTCELVKKYGTKRIF